MRLKKDNSFSYRGICFDLDGVLINTMPSHADAWQAAAKKYGLHVLRREVYLWEGERGKVTAKRLLSRSRKGQAALPRSVTALLSEKEALFSKHARNEKISNSWQALLRALNESGIRLALVTGTSIKEVRHIIPHNIRKYFHTIVTGDRVSHGKPDPEPYRLACIKLRLKPSQVLVIENAPYGIESAKRANVWKIVAIASSLPARYLKEADTVVGTSQKLRILLQTSLRNNGRI